MKITPNINQKMGGGRFKLSVIDAKTKRVVEERPWQKNLILDNGLDLYGENLFCNCWRYCSAGTDNTPVVNDSGITTAIQSGTTITANATSFSASDVGRLFRFDSGEESYITTFTDTTHVEVADSRTVGSSTLFAVWRVDQTNLGAFVKKTNIYVADECGSAITSGSDLLWRTWDFSEEVGNATYREIGVHKNFTDDDGLFSRVLVQGGSISLVAGQQLRVRYEINMQYSSEDAIAGIAISPTITGWPSGGASSVDGDLYALNHFRSLVKSDGSTNETAWINPASGTGFTNVSEASSSMATQLFLRLSTSSAFPAYNTDQDAEFGAGLIATNPWVLNSYIAGTFTRIKTHTLEAAELDDSNVRKIGLGGRASNFLGSVAVGILFDEGQEKLNTHKLILTWRYTWAREIENNP